MTDRYKHQQAQETPMPDRILAWHNYRKNSGHWNIMHPGGWCKPTEYNRTEITDQLVEALLEAMNVGGESWKVKAIDAILAYKGKPRP